jgi:DNA-binding MarR family transcriptional regulator
MSERTEASDDRAQLEHRLGTELRKLTSESDQIVRAFADQNNVSANEFRALLFVMIGEDSGALLTAGDLRKQMKLSGAAITYLVERMVDAGHLRRETDPTDRRKVILRYGERGMGVALQFFSQLFAHNQRAMANLSDEDLEAAHRTMSAMVDGMRAFRAEVAAPNASDLPSSG